MHNSGTSLLGNLMHAAGVPLGPKLLLRNAIPAERRPRYDYFEDEDIVQLQDAALLELQRHWSSYRSSFSLPDEAHPARERFRAALTALVPERLTRSSLWLVKDPRSAVLVDDWLTVLQELGIDCVLLLVHRDPTCNIRSFSSKGQVPALWAEALWQRTYANALNAASRLPRERVLVTSFDQLMQAPEQEVLRLCEGLNWRVRQPDLNRLKERIDPSLPTQKESKPGTNAPATLLHPATLALQQCLLAGRLETKALPTLLADTLAEAVADQQAPLELNGVLCEGQTLLPKLRVSLVTAEFQGWGPGGGIGSAFRELALTLAAAGHPVRVLLVQNGRSGGGASLPGVQIEPLDSAGFSRLALVRRIAELLRTHQADVVHLHDWLGFASGLRQALGPDGPQIVVGLHGPSAWTRSGNPWPIGSDGGLLASEAELFDEGLVRALELDGLDQADWLVSPSTAMAQWVQSELLPNQPQQPVLVNRNCPLAQRLRPNPAGAMASPEQDNQPPIDLVVFGRLEQRKGLHLALDALLQLKPRPLRVLFLGSDCVLGRQADGSPLWGSEQVRQQLEGSGISAVFEHGLLRDAALQHLMALQKPVLIPSLIENSPCVVEELLDSGLPLVVTDVGGTAELVRPADHRWLSKPDAEALAQHLHIALSESASDQDAYRLHAAIDSWRIQLSWQAFHERLPRAKTSNGATPPTWPLWRRALRKTRHLAVAGQRRLLRLLER